MSSTSSTSSSSSGGVLAQFSGLASGIDSSALINATIQEKLQPNTDAQNQIDFLNSESDALGDVKTKLLNIDSLISQFETVNGGGVSKKATSSNAAVATAAVSSAASNTTLGIVVSSVAAAATSSFTDSFTDGSALFAPDASGTQVVETQLGTGADQLNVDVNVDSTTTAQNFVDAFNGNANAQGRAVASLVQVGTNDYRVVISATQTGTDKGQIAFNIPTAAAGFGGHADLQSQTIQQATNAVFSISGISGTITRSSNAVSDVISGVTFQLSSTGSATIGVTDDPSTTADNFQQIVDAYNDLVNYVNTNDTVTQDTSTTDGTITYGTLSKTDVAKNYLDQFRDQLLGTVSGGNGAVQVSSDLGLSTNEDGTITLDQTAFTNAIGTDSEGVSNWLNNFSDASSGVQGFTYQYTEFEGFIDDATTSNDNEITDLQSQMAELQRSADTLKASLTQQYANLESVTAGLQQQQAALASAFSSVSASN